MASSILGTGTFNASSRSFREFLHMAGIESVALAAGMMTLGLGTAIVNVASTGLQATRFAKLANYGMKAGNTFIGK